MKQEIRVSPIMQAAEMFGGLANANFHVEHREPGNKIHFWGLPKGATVVLQELNKKFSDPVLIREAVGVVVARYKDKEARKEKERQEQAA